MGSGGPVPAQNVMFIVFLSRKRKENLQRETLAPSTPTVGEEMLEKN